MKQKTLCLLKPDITRRHLIGEAIQLLEKDFNILKIKMKSLTTNEIEKFYEEHREKVFFSNLAKYMMGGPVIALVLEGEDAIMKLREMMGHLNPQLAKEGSLRKRFGISIDENSFHGSDSEKSAEREIKIIFEK